MTSKIVIIFIAIPVLSVLTDAINETNLIEDELPILPRCCSTNQYYDPEDLKCSNSQYPRKIWLSEYLNLFELPMLSKKPIHTSLDCKGSPVIRYEVQIDDLRYGKKHLFYKNYETSQFHINVHNVNMSTKYCIDPTESFMDSVIIQVCQDATVCKDGCLRKCVKENGGRYGVTTLLIKAFPTEYLTLDKNSFNRFEAEDVGTSIICQRGFESRTLDEDTLYRVSEAGEMRLPGDKHGYLKLQSSEYCVYPATILSSAEIIMCPKKIYGESAPPQGRNST